MKDEFTNKELQCFEEIEDDLIIELFQTTDKRNAIRRAIKRAFQLGRIKR